jgi:hypothetical protein
MTAMAREVELERWELSDVLNEIWDKVTALKDKVVCF